MARTCSQRPPLRAALLAGLVLCAGAQPARALVVPAQATIGAIEVVEEESPSARPAAAPAGAADAGTAAAAPQGDSAAAAPIVIPLDHSGQGVVPVAETEESIVRHWRLRLEDLEARDARRAEEEEREIERIQKTLALENLFGVAAALVRESDELRRRGQSAEAVKRCQLATRVAPRFDAAWLCLARASAANWSLVQAATAAVKAASVSLSDVRSGRNAVADELVALLAGLAAGAAVLLVLLGVRHGRLALHDIHHLFPRDSPPWQTALFVLVLVALPALLGAGLVTSLAVGCALFAFFISRAEAAAAATALTVLAVAGLAAPHVLSHGAFGPHARDLHLLERGDAPAVAAARLEARLAGHPDYATAFAVGRYHKRLGRLERAQKAYEQARALSETGDVLNNLGTVRFLRGDVKGARELYRQANARAPNLAAPLYNLAKLYFREGQLEPGNQAQRQALEIGGDAIRAFGFADDMRANRYLMDVPLPDAAIAQAARAEASRLAAMDGPVWRALAGRDGTLSLAALLFAAALMGSAQGLRRRVRASTRCEKCGHPVCGRCDPDIGPLGAALCSQCVSVFVRRTGVDAPDRVRKELEVRRHRGTLRVASRVAGALLAGAGHVLTGRTAVGAVLLALHAVLLARVALWHGYLRAPVPLEATTAPRVALYVVLLAAACALSLVHLMRHEEAD